MFVGKRADFLLLRFRQHTTGSGIPRNIIQLDSFFKRDMEDFINKPDGGRRKTAEPIYKTLDRVRVQLRQFHRAHGGLDMVLDVAGVYFNGPGLGTAQVILCPDVQPLPHGEPGRLRIGPGVDGHGGGLELLPDLPLCLAGERALDLLPRAGVPARGDPGFPIGILFPIPGDCFLADGPAALGPLLRLRHKNSPVLSKMVAKNQGQVL